MNINIFYKGRNHGDWDTENLPRLAASLGATVEEILAETEAESQKRAVIKAVDSQVKTRLGDEKKIARVTADAAMIGLIVSAALLEAITSSENLDEVRGSIHGVLFKVFGAETLPVAALLETLGKYESGEIKTPIHAKTVAGALAKVEFCANEAFNIMLENAPTPAPEQIIDPALAE